MLTAISHPYTTPRYHFDTQCKTNTIKINKTKTINNKNDITPSISRYHNFLPSVFLRVAFVFPSCFLRVSYVFPSH